MNLFYTLLTAYVVGGLAINVVIWGIFKYKFGIDFVAIWKEALVK